MPTKTFKGFLAWMGTWVAGLSIGQHALGIESFGLICAWGVFVYFICEAVEVWINLPSKVKEKVDD